MLKHLILALYLVLFGFLLAGFGQVPSRETEKGFVPGVAYASSEFENINLTNGNLVFNFPLGGLPRGRGEASAGLALRYNSKLWKKHIENLPQQNGTVSKQSFLGRDLDGGWNYGQQYTLKLILRNDGLDEPVQYCDNGPNFDGVYQWKVQVEFPDGSVHEFRPVGYSSVSAFSPTHGNSTGNYFNVSPFGVIESLAWSTTGGQYSCSITTSHDPNSYMTYYSSDGSYMRLKIFPGNNELNPDWELVTADGGKVTNSAEDGQKVFDRNGNYVRFGDVTLPDSTQAVGWIDQFNRFTAIKATSSTEDTIYQMGANDQLLEWKIRWKPITVIKKYRTDCSVCDHERGQTTYQVVRAGFRVVDNIHTPNGQTFTFDYYAHDGDVALDPDGGTTSQNWSPGWGEVKSVLMPSTARSQYDYDIYDDEPPNGYIMPEEVISRTGRVTEKKLFYTDVYDGGSTARELTWTYYTSEDSSSVTNPDGSGSGEAFFNIRNDENRGGYVYKDVKSDGSIIERIWAYNNPTGFSAGKPANPYVKTEFHTIPNASGTPSLTAIKDFNYDKNGNVTQTTEYEWVPYSAIAHDTATGLVTGIPSSAVKSRVTATGFYNAAGDASVDSTTVNDPNGYWNPSAVTLKRAAQWTELQNGSGQIFSRSELAYDDPATTGNITSTSSWDSFKGGASRSLNTADPNSGSRLDSNNSISTSTVYNAYGMPTQTTDASGVQTTITYGCIDGSASCSSSLQNLYPTRTEIASNYSALKRTSTTTYDFNTGLTLTSTDEDNHLTSKTVYDDFGRPIKAISAYGDALESWTTTTYHDGDSSDPRRYVVVKADIESKGDGRKVATQFYDQLGRVRLAKTLEDAEAQSATNEADGIKVQTRYKTVSGYTYQLTSNPYRASTSSGASSEETMGWTLSTAWSSGVRSEVQTFSGAGLPSAFGGSNTSCTGVVRTDIDAERTLVTDQAGKKRISKSNALGQLTDVWEVMAASDSDTVSVTFPNTSVANGYHTSYSYNALGKMVRVQQGDQNRYFLYDSLGRTLRVRQPEQEVNTALDTTGNPDNNSWTAGLTYDNNGNVLTTKDANGTTVTTTYDELNRPKQRSYNDSPPTPTVNFYYDGNGLASAPDHSKGKLTKVTSIISETTFTEFDALGRLLSSTQRTPLDGETVSTATARTSSYQYNLAGALTHETYPSGRIVSTEFDANGDLARISGKATSTSIEHTHATGFSYFADGKIEKLKLGNNLWESAKLNSRLQAKEIDLGYSVGDGSLWKDEYVFGELESDGTTVDETKNAGNIAKQTISFNGLAHPYIQTYKYDSLDRISEARETLNGTQTWKQTFGFDRYGNRNGFYQKVGSTELWINSQTLPSVVATSNRFDTGQNIGYDKNGNITGDVDAVTGHSRQFVFNGDNKQVQVNDTTASVTKGTYYFDGSGRRVKKVTADETTVFVYDGMGKLVAEYSTATPPENPTINYTATDQLGSPRVITNSYGEVVSRRDFMPFGEELYADGTNRKTDDHYSTTGQDAVRQRFTGYQLDLETSLDFAEARMYNNQHGRFTAVDPLLASGKSADPQTFNRYAYVMNDPLSRTDQTGLQAATDPETIDGGTTHACEQFGFVCKASSIWTYVKRGVTQLGRALWGSDNFDQDEQIAVNERKRTGLDKQIKNAVVNYGNDLNKVTETAVEVDPTGILNASKVTTESSLGRASDEEVTKALGSMIVNTIAATIPADRLLTGGGKLVKHHIFNAFRGSSPKSEVYRAFFRTHGIDVESFLVEIPEEMHRKFIHAAGKNWTTKWKQWIDANPNATSKEIYQFAGQLMDEFGLTGVPIGK